MTKQIAIKPRTLTVKLMDIMCCSSNLLHHTNEAFRFPTILLYPYFLLSPKYATSRPGRTRLLAVRVIPGFVFGNAMALKGHNYHARRPPPRRRNQTLPISPIGWQKIVRVSWQPRPESVRAPPSPLAPPPAWISYGFPQGHAASAGFTVARRYMGGKRSAAYCAGRLARQR
jgi:hypothetical protein